VRSRFALQQGNPLGLRDHLRGGILRCISFGSNPHEIRSVLKHPETMAGGPRKHTPIFLAGGPRYNRNFLERSSSIKRVNFRLIHKSK
jgi:hypothetical protein